MRFQSTSFQEFNTVVPVSIKYDGNDFLILRVCREPGSYDDISYFPTSKKVPIKSIGISGKASGGQIPEQIQAHL